MDLCRVQPHETILDVGAGVGGALERFNRENPIVAVELEPEHTGWLEHPNVRVEQGDGTKLRYADGEFPVVYSNSVIEHVPQEFQQAFADETRRVGQRYFVQTPNRWFPIEPHYQTPLFHFLPVRAQKWLNRHFTIGWREKGHWEDVTLLSARDLGRLFPDAEIHRERLFGLTKSLMAVRREP
jgi:SAM-dependent methyltransferase